MRDRALAFVTLVLASCSSTPPAPPPCTPLDRPVLVVAAPEAAPRDEPAPRPAERATGVEREVWKGEYLCPQGLTALMLSLRREDDGSLQAVFMFSASEKNPGVPSGSYTLVGQIRPDGSFELKPSQWLDRPPGYVMVGMAGVVAPDGTSMRGRITEDMCGGFELHRDSFR